MTFVQTLDPSDAHQLEKGINALEKAIHRRLSAAHARTVLVTFALEESDACDDGVSNLDAFDEDQLIGPDAVFEGWYDEAVQLMQSIHMVHAQLLKEDQLRRAEHQAVEDGFVERVQKHLEKTQVWRMQARCSKGTPS